MNLKTKIKDIPNWPKNGVNFKDITPLLEDAKCFQYAINELAKPFNNIKIDKIVGIDARGFLLASALAYKLKLGIAIVRKQGKLPEKLLVQIILWSTGKTFWRYIKTPLKQRKQF